MTAVRFLLLVCLAPAVIHAQTSAPGNNGGCPALPPKIEGGDACTNVPDFTDCKYDGFTWPGTETASQFRLTCTCFTGVFACSQAGVAITDPSNDKMCPSSVPSSGDMCTTSVSQDCQYRDPQDDIVTRCTCFDGAFGCSQPSIDADPDNHVDCPAIEPILTGGDSCIVPEGTDCKYRSFFFSDSTEVTYIARCSCFGGRFACSEQGAPSANPSNDASCPISQPTLEGGDSCDISGAIDCVYISDNEEKSCACLFGTFACAVAAPTDPSSDAPDNHPQCPATQPEIGSMCETPSNSDCMYRPFYWPGSSSVTYIGRCTCFSGIFQCAEQSVPEADPDNHVACPATTPDIGSDCSNGGPPSSEDCQYREGPQSVLRCTCFEDGTFQCAPVFSPDADPDNHPFCPVMEPKLGDLCDDIPTDCLYRKPSCGDTAVVLVPYTYACSCLSGSFACFETENQICEAIFCFAGDSTVEIEGHGSIPMKQLQIGDKVHVGKNQYEPVYSFGHYNPSKQASFLKVETTNSPLLVSEDHMLNVQSRGFVPASNLSPGDKLVDGSTGDDVIIKSIRTVQAQGVFAPFTPSGKIVVNGVIASSFVALDSQPSLSIVAGLQLSHHWIAHTFEFPHRVMCHYLAQCATESYTTEGISDWVSGPMKLSQWVLAQNTMVRTSLLVLFAVVLALLASAEAFLNYPMLLAACTAVGIYHRRKNQAKYV